MIKTTQTIRSSMTRLLGIGLLGLGLLLCTSKIRAQVNYSMTPLSGLTYTPIIGGTVINTTAGLTAGVMTSSQDDGAAIVTLPFTFNYNGTNFTQATFCTNGWLGLGSQSTVTSAQSRTPANLFTSTAPNATIAPWFKDMGANFPLGGGAMVHGLIAPDVYAFEWRNANGSGFGDGSVNTINFMVVLYGPSSSSPGRIELLYGPTAGAITFSAAIGIEDASGLNYYNAVTNNRTTTTTSTAWPGNGNGYRFNPLVPSRAITTATGGNWSSAATWVGGVVPSIVDTIEVVSGSTLTLDLTGPNFIGSMEVSGNVNFASAATNAVVNRGVTINTGGGFDVFNGTAGKTLTVARNITNNGNIDLSKTGALLVLNGNNAQSIDGTGTLTSNTITSLTFNNTTPINPIINWQWSNVIIPGTLTFTSGFVDLGATNSMTLGASSTVLGTLTYTAGGFISGKFGRWFGTAGTGTTITASTVPAFGEGSFPFAVNNPALGGYGACHFHRATAALTTPGIFEVRFTGLTGASALPSAVTENSIVLDSQTNAMWSVSTSGGYASTANHSFAIQGQNTYIAFGTNARLLISGALQGTHQTGTNQPMVQRTAIPAGSISGDYTIGLVGSEFPTTTIASGAWNNPAIWSNGAPVCGKNVIIGATDSVWVDGTMGIQNSNNIALNGRLTITGGTLNAGCSNNNISLTAPAASRLTVSGGTFNLNGNINLAAGSFFAQTGGNINIDGNASGVPDNSVPSGTPLALIATGNVTLSGGVFTIVDPHAGAVSLANNLAFSYTGGTAINNTTGWTLKFGDGLSTDSASTTANAGFVLNMAGSKIVIDSLVINAGLSGINRFVTLNNATTFGCNTMNITTDGQARISSQTVIARNLINNGRLVNTAGAVTFGTFLNATVGTSSFPQVISGTGGFRNLLTNSTASFTTLTINNNHPSGVSFLADSVLLGGANTGTVSGTFTLTNGIVNTGAGTRAFVLGISAASAGTLTYTAGGFGPGSTFSRWWATTASVGQTISASTIPTAGVGTYPFVTLATVSPFTLNSRIAYVRQLTASATGGRVNIRHNDVAGLSIVSIADGAYTVDNRSNANWEVSTTGITGTPTYTVALSGSGIYPGANGNSRITLASGPLSGTHQAGTTLPHAQRATVTFSDMNATWYIGANAADVSFKSIASGNWENGAIWNKGVAPSCLDSVVIDNEHTVTIGGAAANARAIAINTSGVLNITGNTTTVGCTMNNSSIRVSGKLTVSGGTVNINGALLNNPSGRVHHLGGSITVDGNDSGKVATSWGGHQVDMYATTDTSVIFTGGIFTVVDPTVNASSAAFKVYPNQPVNFGLGHTLRFGNGVSTEPGGALGYQINLFNTGTGLASLGNVVVNSPWGTNRFVNTTNTVGILGNLTITAGNYRMTSLHTVKGNIVNNDTLVNTSTLTLADPINAITSTNTTAQSITGTGVFLNAATGATAGMTNLTVRNSSAGGVTIGTKLSVSGTLTLTRGIVNTNATDTFRLGTAAAAGTLSGGSDSAFVNGPIYRTYPASRTAVGTYTDATRYPVGKNGRYLPLWIDPNTTSGGSVILSGEAFTTNAGTLGTGATSVSSVRWQSFVGAGATNFTGSNLRLTDTASSFGPTTKIMFAPSATGAYIGAAPTIVYAAGPPKTITTTGSLITPANYTGFFAYGEVTPCSTPANQPTAFNVANLGATQFDGSFTAAASAPSHYLVVRYATGQPEVPPTNNTTYNVNATLGTGTVVANITTTSFSQTGLTAGTAYDYYIYSYNNSGCFGPVYNTTSALFATVTTCATAVTTPTAAAAVNVTNVSLTARWSRDANPAVTYVLDVSTSNTFATFLPGYQNFSTGTDTFAIINGLSATTSYFYRVRAVDGTCASGLSTTITTTTFCNPVTTLPWTENFDGITVGANNFPSCWLKENTASTKYSTSNATTYNTARSGTNYLRCAWSSTNEFMWTPGFTLVQGQVYSFSFWAQGDGYTSWSLDVFYNTSPNSLGSTQLGTTYSPTGPGTATIQNYVLRTYTIVAPSNGTYYFAIRVNEASGAPWYFAFDDFKFELTTPPTVVTGTKLNITQSSVNLTGNITSTGGSAITTAGIVVGTSPNPIIGGVGVIDSIVTPTPQSGSYNKSINGLNGATTYYYRAYATNIIGTTYGSDSSFTTLAAAVAPTVTKSAATNVSGFAATLNGNVVSDGGDPISTSGIVYSTTSNPVIGGVGVVDSVKTPTVTSGPFTVAAAGLIPNTKYYFRAYAINSVGTSYSVQDSFTTEVVINNLPYTQNFEGGAGSWTTTTIGTGLNVWVRGTPVKTFINGAYSGANAFVTTLTGNYAGAIDCGLVSPLIDLTGYTNPVIRFRHKHKTDLDLNWDGGVVEISVNGGAWTRLDNATGTGTNFNTPISYSWYNNASTSGTLGANKFNGITTSYSTNDNGWIESATRLTGGAGQSNVRVRFRFWADAIGTDEGWAIDDIEIVDVITPTTPASAVNLTNIGATNTTVNWTNGNGQGRIVVARLTTTPAVAPTNDVLYGSSSAFGGNDSTGTGNYIVYRSNGTSAVVTNLTLLTDYTYDVYEFNGKYMHTRFATGASNSGTTLPVTLNSFAATVKDADVLLTWTTASEVNNRGFDVERSIDGKTFEYVGFVKGAGNSNVTNNYKLEDVNPFVKQGVSKLYYRLKQIDFNGETAYSNIAVVNNNELTTNGLSVFPNPFSTGYTIEFNSTASGTANVDMFNIQGKLVSEQSINVNKGLNAITFDNLATLQTGIYFVKLTVNGETRVLKLLKN